MTNMDVHVRCDTVSSTDGNINSSSSESDGEYSFVFSCILEIRKINGHYEHCQYRNIFSTFSRNNTMPRYKESSQYLKCNIINIFKWRCNLIYQRYSGRAEYLV